MSSQEYELWLSPDSSTNGHTQWYFFSIANGKPGVQYRLHIQNFRKAHSLYSQGLQPLLHSAKEASLTVSPPSEVSQAICCSLMQHVPMQSSQARAANICFQLRSTHAQLPIFPHVERAEQRRSCSRVWPLPPVHHFVLSIVYARLA